MREIDVQLIQDTIYELFLSANFCIGLDIIKGLEKAKEQEQSSIGQSVLSQLLENYEIAKTEQLPICQDTGMAIIFLKVGQDVHFVNGSLNEAIQSGVARAYKDGYLRKSVVDDPIYDRVNTKDNTPAIIYTEIVEGNQIELTITAKGFGSENMSAIKMLSLSDGEQGVIDFIMDTVSKAGPNACPPMVLGIGIGGSFDKAAQLAKYATTRPIHERNQDERYAKLEDVLLSKINKLGIGPAGLGGTTTCLRVNIEYYPTHIASLPVAVNICCHAARHAHRVL